ncbi:hypothetical protein COCMIDRAFT_100541 [Bipolaris oryzae ATCC 44560]|uniref:Uncharacterized protein n=1 Tax=Bipolaris oryzae ATCC 44560 TaxID=930090 RepID=W6Z0Q1_COCMI|nr:uncharacterized protein COCMIDRAFT_100541 [Bipolaris oryzae ATCC 44560]EUC43535.1 hypothetical protein COCMIDRAFT_100541 [Bipolaris oryzae ATCC 44560]
MANDEQRRAFESYMGRANSDNGQVQSPSQPLAQYPGSVAQPGNPYLYQQFPGLGVPPAAPTPPPAASSSVASFPGYQGGYSQPSYGLGVYGSNGIPQRPPPLGDPQAQQQQVQQQTPTGSGFQGHVQGSGSYSAQPPPPLSHSGWPYNHTDSGMASHRDVPVTGAVVPTYRSHTQEVVRSSSRHRREEYYYHSRDPAQTAQAPLVEEVVVPVMLCHTCSHCGQMRSAGYHRNNPVVPGKPLVSTPCRRCKKKLDNLYRSSSRYTRIRKCTADEPCDWPREPFRVDAGQDESRGRRRSREEVYVNRYSPSRPRVVRRESSVAHLGLGAYQQSSRKERGGRRSSSSPCHSTRYTGGVWPPPDIVRLEPRQADQPCSVPLGSSISYASKSEEVWPPPDIVRTHSYRDVERKSLRRQSSRIIELSPSPPPSRPKSTRVVYRSDSQEHRRRSISKSPSRVRSRGERRSEEAEPRLTSHPLPFRTVISDCQHASFHASDETCSNAESIPRQNPESPTCSILKPGSIDHRDTTSQRRASVRASEQSVHVEVGGPPRVRFSGERREELSDREPARRSRYNDEDGSSKKKSEYYQDHSRERVQYETRPRPRPNQDFEKVRTRYCSPVRDRDYEEEIRVDKQRRISPSPSPPRIRSREYEEIRVRHVSPLPVRRSLHDPLLSDCDPSPPPPPPLYRHVSRAKALDDRRSVASPSPPTAHSREEDHTDCSSTGSGDVTVVTRTWKGIDENGRPATFVEERREVKMLAEGSERGGAAREYRDLGYGDRVSSAGNVWRDV